ncbi:MAG: helix-turn-helix transcriptional regulator [Ilumatobacteraceae bacterium]
MDDRRLEQQLGLALRRRRVAQGVTRAALADRANVSAGALRNLETGAGANVTTLVRAVHALGADDWLTQLEPAPAPFSPLAVVEQTLHADQHADQRWQRPRARPRRPQ